MQMTEEQLMAVVGRLYVGTLVRDNELRRLNGLVNEYERAALTPDEENQDGESPKPS